jgi:hypothetical protein
MLKKLPKKVSLDTIPLGRTVRLDVGSPVYTLKVIDTKANRYHLIPMDKHLPTALCPGHLQVIQIKRRRTP